jgi:carboxymethylenebutenolidase
MFEASHLQHSIVSGYIQIVSDGHHLPAFWSHPDLGGPFPGLVLLHDHWGLTPHIRSQVRRFAELGYYVIAPDLFNKQTADTPAQAEALVQQLGETTLAQVKAALHALKSHNRCNGKVGLLGWGWGARLALETAVFRDDLRALTVFYGLPDQLQPAELRMLSCPLLGLFAAEDPAITPEQIAALRTTLEQAGLEHEIVVYPDVSRGFFNDAGSAFQATAAQDAWQRALDFLGDKLELPKPPDPDEFDPGRVY